IGISLIAVMLTIMSLCSCGSSNSIVGNWVCQEVHDGYPDQMTLKDDGTGMVEGVSCSWNTNNDKLSIIAGSYGQFDYTYKIDGQILYLDSYAYDKK
ncbi:MAG: hypothetical protein IJI39_10240, partial [Clostridia bacterium]|nr:hypothetical protein [Clostridia bacterium]